MNRQLFGLFIALCTLGVSPQGIAVTYYVDSDSGNDSNSGTDLSAAWRSLSQIGSAGLQAGDVVLLRAGQTHSGSLDLDVQGTQGAPVRVSAYGSGSPPVLQDATLSGSWLVLENLEFDQQGGNADVIRIRGGDNLVLRDLEIHNGTRDGIDVVGAENLTLTGLHIHHLLAGSFTDQLDAHGIALSDAHNVLIDNVDIHHVSGDSVQVDPNRQAGAISSDITISNATLWTGPLASTFNSGWVQGQVPGENALDTKVVKTGFESEPRMQITIRNVVAHGWTQGSYITNRAAFNLKEKVSVSLDRVTVYNSEIAFRLRGVRGNANVQLSNALVYDTDIAFRTESDLENLQVNHLTVGSGVGEVLRKVASGSAFPGWNWQNAVTLVADSDLASLGVVQAQANDFLDPAQHNYRLSAQSSLRDAGTTTSVTSDLDGTPRDQRPDIGAFEYSAAGIPLPPVILNE